MRVTFTTAQDCIIVDGGLYGLQEEDDTLAAWRGTAGVRAEVKDIPQRPGSYFPKLMLPSNRVVPFHGETWARASTTALAAMTRLNGLSEQPVEVCVEDGAGPLWARGFISDVITPAVHWGEQLLQWSVTATFPDPRKYGPPVTLPPGRIENVGNAPAFPILQVTGRATALVAVLDGQETVTWEGDTTDLTIDLADGVPRSHGERNGALILDDLMNVTPGVHQLDMTVTGGGTPSISFRSAWK